MGDRTQKRLFISSLIHTVLPIALPMIILSLLISHFVGLGIINEVDNANMARLEQNSAYIENQFSSLEHLEMVLSSSPTVRYRLSGIFSDNGLISYDEYLVMDIARDLLDSAMRYSDIAESIYIYFPNNEGWFFSSGGISMLSADRDTLWYEILQDAEEEELGSWSGFRLTNWSDGKTVFSIIIPISPLSSWDEGALILNADPNAVTEMLYSLSSDQGGSLIITNEDGALIFSTFDDPREANRIINNDSSDIVKYSKQMNSGWNLYLVIERSDAYRLKNIVDILVLFLTALVILIAAFVSFRRTEEELTVLSLLEEELNSNKKGHQGLYLKMSKELIRSYQGAKKLNYERRELELTQLSLQLTPHFLFNTLQSIRWKAVDLTKCENEASQMIGDLSNLLSYALRHQSLFSTLEEELEATRSYIKIQEKRFPDDFEYEEYINEEVDSALRIPKMILQPLLENSINHGIRGLNEKKKIKIKFFINSGKDLKVQIIDNGRGIEKEKLRRIRRSLAKSKTDDISIGLSTVNNRLRLLFNPSEHLSIQSREKKGTVVSFSIPLDSAKFKGI